MAHPLLIHAEHDQREHHADGAHEEGGVEAPPWPDEVRDQRREQRTDVDAHVEDEIRLVLEVTAFAIEVADHRRDVRLEEPVADDEECEGEIADEEVVGDCQERVADHEGHAADHDRLAEAGEAISDQAAEERREVDEHVVGRDDRRGAGIREPEALGGVTEIEREHRPDGVEAVPLPHLGSEQDVQPSWMFLGGGAGHSRSSGVGRRLETSTVFM